MTRSLRTSLIHTMLGLVAILLLSACTPTVQVAAPDKPIEINMNIKIEQEVRIKVDKQLDELFAEDPELFGTTE